MEDHDNNNNNNNSENNNNNNNNIINTTTSSITSSSSKSEKNNNNNGSSEPVRSRWTPKPEQILILESIFNSGMVNPPKEETVRIRKLLEKFGAVGDANVFYWFQNRRSRSRRRQRQLQASLAAATQPPQPPPSPHAGSVGPPPPPHLLGGGGGNMYDFGHNHNHNTCTTSTNSVEVGSTSSSVTCFGPSCSTSSGNSTNFGDCVDDVFGSFSGQMGLINPNPNHQHHHQQHQLDCPSQHPNLEFQSGGIITVFLNGVATQVPDGPFDMKAMFGEEVILVHSSGVPVPFNDFGISFHSLQHGETYFLVPRLG